MPDDAQLLRRYAEENSEAAFTELVARHLDRVYSAALRQVGGDAHHAQDVAQTVFDPLTLSPGSSACIFSRCRTGTGRCGRLWAPRI